jgi:NAD-dependent dihydropyrimidine dehydrogenase PreA subunit
LVAAIDFPVCNGCEECVNLCPADVLYFDENSKKPYIAFPEDCLDCYTCALFCPLECIKIHPTRFRLKPTYG